MVYDEKWSYTYEQIESYVVGCGASACGNVYSLESCRIRLQRLPDRTVGRLMLPVTRVLIDGPGADEFYHGFYLHFLSGGA